MLNKRETGIFLILLLAIVSVAILLSADPIPQEPSYHRFSDAQTILGVPNAINVLSNILFFIVGVLGLRKILKFDSNNIVTENRLAYIVLFFSIILVALGSGYYHLWPDNNTLVWDRLPMAMAFMGLFSVVVSEFVSVKLGKYLLFPCLILGVISVLYWHYTELKGYGDLRLYAFVQFYPMLLIPVLLLFFTAKFTNIKAYWLLLAAYFMAKLFEHFDQFVHSLLHVVSGHSLKHLVSAFGLYLLLRGYETRSKYITNSDKR